MLPVVASDLYLGNIHVLLGAAVVGSLRRPGLWAIPLLTKPTVGVGLLWYVVRGEWRRLAVALGVTGSPRRGSVRASRRACGGNGSTTCSLPASHPTSGAPTAVPLPLLLRLPAAALLVIWGARTNRPWTLPTAAMLGLPVLWLVGLAMLAGAFAVSAWGPLRDAARRWKSK